MYNRYIPQPDGSYRRRRIPDPLPPKPPQAPPPAESDCAEPKPSCPPPADCGKHRGSGRGQHEHSRREPQKHDSPTGSLWQLLPKNLDTGDLLVMALLLLMAGDCQEDKSTALLTLALYLFL